MITYSDPFGNWSAKLARWFETQRTPNWFGIILLCALESCLQNKANWLVISWEIVMDI